MVKKSLKKVALNGVLWSVVDKFAIQGGQLLIGIVLARLLMPEDFGLIGMLSIFLAISLSFVDSGMGSGLIQKKNATSLDFSTVFIFNFLVSVFFYFVLYFAAPFIAVFYETPQLVLLTRVLSLNIIINSLAIVQRSKLTIVIDFKTIAKVNLVSVFLGGLIAVYCAYIGFGVWSLVIQVMVSSLTSVIMFWLLGNWKPSIAFSKKSFKELFGFGSKLLLASVYSKLLTNIYNIVIGKAYSSTELGYYTRAKSFAEIASGTVGSVLQQVTYPLLASIQDNETRMVSVYKRVIGMTAFFIFPVMTLFALLADPLVKLVLTDKWIPIIGLLQLMCFARIVKPISFVNMNILNAIGRSDLFLKVDLSKLPIIILTLVITIPLGIKAMVIGHVCTSITSFFINAYMPGKLFGYGALNQLKDMVPVIISTFVMAFSVYISVYFLDNLYLKIILGVLVGSITYLFMSYVFKAEELKEIKQLLLKVRTKK